MYILTADVPTYLSTEKFMPPTCRQKGCQLNSMELTKMTPNLISVVVTHILEVSSKNLIRCNNMMLIWLLITD